MKEEKNVKTCLKIADTDAVTAITVSYSANVRISARIDNITPHLPSKYEFAYIRMVYVAFDSFCFLFYVRRRNRSKEVMHADVIVSTSNWALEQWFLYKIKSAHFHICLSLNSAMSNYSLRKIFQIVWKFDMTFTMKYWKRKQHFYRNNLRSKKKNRIVF